MIKVEAIDFKKVIWFAERAEAAYKDEATIRQQLPRVTWYKLLKDIDVQYFVETVPEQELQLVSIRGTCNRKNFIEDEEYLLTRNEKLGIYLHHGFDRDASAIYADLLPVLDRRYKVSVTGHSLGAAIATVIMIFLKLDGFMVDRSVNFGQPKFTVKPGVEKYAATPVLRVVDDNDLVPLVPPVTLLDSNHGVYEHLGPEVILLRDQYYVHLDEHDAEKDSLGSFWKNILHENLKDHHMANYLARIQSKLNTSVAVPYPEREQYK